MPVTHAFAKLNLSLEIVGRRPDGFHDLVSVMQTVSLADTLTVTRASDLEFACNLPGLSAPLNLAYRAVVLLRDTHQVREGCAINLTKAIPAAAGLGGGSSDAAAALVAVARLWKVTGSCSSLVPLAERLGSDVPFFLTGGTALVEGRGEHVSSLPPISDTWYILVKPAIGASTRDVFAALRPSDWSDGGTTCRMARSIRSGRRVEIGTNSLQAALFRVHPEAAICFAAVERLFPGRTMLSGSGPTVFAVCDDHAEAAEGVRRLSGRYWATAVRSCSPPPHQTPCR
jgi:4-diphosphocytidyl-2-C-methyl-D-erythritol kinase